MIELVKFELKKIFSNKLIYILMAAFCVCMIAYTIRDYKDVNDSFGSKQELISIAEKFKNGNYSDADLKKMTNKAREKYMNDEKLTKEETFLFDYSNSVSITDGEKKTVIDENPYTYDQVKQHIDELKANGKENTFEYNNFVKAESMMSKLSKPQNLYKGNWDSLFDGVNATIKIALLVLGLATIYSREYKTRVSYLNLSTKKGKTSLNTAKIIAALIYTVFIFAFMTIMYRIRVMVPGLANGNAPMNSFNDFSIFNISINQYYGLTLLMSLLGMICFSLLIVLLSLLTKNVLVSFGLPLGLYLLGEGIELPKKIMQYTANINFTRLLKGSSIFEDYITFDVFGKPVLYPYMIITFAVVSIIIMSVLCHIFNKKQVIA